MKLIILGAPGAGKGTQAEVVCEKYGIPAISTGALLRESIKDGAPLGLEAKVFVDQGQLVPDGVVIGIIKERLKKDDAQNGFILDGFPRTVPQAKALTEMGVKIDSVVSIEVPDEEIVTRLSGRRVCLDCGASYHTSYHPVKDGIHCDKCGSEVAIRQDDNPDTVQKRLRVYHEQTEPLKEYYLGEGKLKIVIGQEEIADTTAELLKVLEV